MSTKKEDVIDLVGIIFIALLVSPYIPIVVGKMLGCESMPAVGVFCLNNGDGLILSGSLAFIRSAKSLSAGNVGCYLVSKKCAEQ